MIHGTTDFEESDRWHNTQMKDLRNSEGKLCPRCITLKGEKTPITNNATLCPSCRNQVTMLTRAQVKRFKELRGDKMEEV